MHNSHNDEHVDDANDLDIAMTMYNLIEYNDNYSDTSRSLWQFKRSEQNIINGNIPVGVDSTNSTSFEYKSSSIKKSDDGAFKNVKIAVRLKYLSNVWRSLEMRLINCKIHLELNWSENCMMSSVVGTTTLKITTTKLYVLIVLCKGKTL